MNNNLNHEEKNALGKVENNLVLDKEELSVQLSDDLTDYQENNSENKELIPEFEPLELTKIPSERISTKPRPKSLYHLNKNLAQVAQKLANQPELNGLFVTGLIANTILQIQEGVLEVKKEPDLDKQAAGVAVINRLKDIVPDRFVKDSREPFIWKEPEKAGKTYQFEVEGGDLIQVDGKTQLTPKNFQAIDLNSGEQIFQATSLDNRSWHIKQCDFSTSQLRALTQAENLLQKQKEEKVEGQFIPKNQEMRDTTNVPSSEIER